MTLKSLENDNLTLSQAIVEATDTLSHFVVPLYFDDEMTNRPVLFGTGFFIRHGKNHFLVSAAHVIAQTAKSALYFYKTPNLKCHILGKGLTTKPPGGNGHDDPIDIAIWKMPSEESPPFPEVNKHALDAACLRPLHLPRAGRTYVMLGFPATKSKVEWQNQQLVAASLYAYRSDSISDSKYQSYEVSPETHIILPFNKNKGVDLEGRHVNLPDPNGMSGAPIFVLYEENSNSAVFPLVGVGIEYRKQKKCVVGADIHTVVKMIESAGEW